MGQIGRFIDRCVAREPELMQRVLDRPWGTLSLYRSDGPDGEPCGCLVGSVGIEAGALPGFECEAAARVAQMPVLEVAAVGSGGFLGCIDERVTCVLDLRARIACRARVQRRSVEADLFTIDLLKRRIARRLAERRQAARRPAMIVIKLPPEPCGCDDEKPCPWHWLTTRRSGLEQRPDETARQFVRRCIESNEKLSQRVAQARRSHR